MQGSWKTVATAYPLGFLRRAHTPSVTSSAIENGGAQVKDALIMIPL